MATATQKPFAVITGASSGIGFELARQFADHGYDIMIAAEDSGIVAAAAALRTSGGSVVPVQVDLSTAEGADTLWAEINQQGRYIDAIALNAGVGVGGAFSETDIHAELKMIALNVTSTTYLAKKAVQHMMPRNHGRILFTASIVSVLPSPFQAVYAATKAYVLSLSDALRSELKETEISVTALMPGATDTNFFERADLMNTKVGQSDKDDPADVARDAFKAMMEGQGHVISHSFMNRIQGLLGEILPEDVKTAMLRKQTQPGSGKH